MTRVVYLVGTAIISAVPGVAAQAATVQGARVWAGPSYTRVVFDLSGPAQYKLSQQDGQVVLELSDSQLDAGFGAPSAQGLFKGVEGRRSSSAIRLVTTISQNSQPKAFMLGPSGQAGARLVLDLYPGAAGKPTEATVATLPPTPPTAAVTAVVDNNDGNADAPAASAVPAFSPSDSKYSRKGLSTRQAAVLLNSQRPVIIAVDAGHGGKDQGAHGPDGTLEKNVTLAVARDLAAEIDKQPGMKAILTRDGDYFIPLKRRYEIAREHDADLFVAIHADSYVSSDARGSSVWVLSSRGKSSEAARWLADRENSSDLIGGVSLDDKSDGLASVLLDMQQGWAVQASQTVAENVLRGLAQLGPTHRGYVEQANFVVLRSPDVPSILVETAFISNPDEENKLRDPGHQQKLAAAVMNGVRGYFENNPPPGTWFALDAARRKGVLMAGTDDPRPASDAKTVATGTASRSVASVSATSANDDDLRDLHRVMAGESLRSIAHQYGVSVDAIKNVNGMNGDSVHAGMVLAIPAS